jgi:hypothetical protein
MTRKLLVLLAALATILGLTVPTATSASALGGEWLGCYTYPGDGYYHSDGCITGSSDSQIVLDFVVMDETAPSTYSWAVPSTWVPNISDGCTSSTNYCQLIVGRGGKIVTVSVTLSQGGATETLSSTVDIEPMCGGAWC